MIKKIFAKTFVNNTVKWYSEKEWVREKIWYGLSVWLSKRMMKVIEDEKKKINLYWLPYTQAPRPIFTHNKIAAHSQRQAVCLFCCVFFVRWLVSLLKFHCSWLVVFYNFDKRKPCTICFVYEKKKNNKRTHMILLNSLPRRK